MSNVNGTLRRSVLINMVGRYSNIVIQLMVTAILARALSPKEFGLMAVVSVIAVFLSFLSEMGLGPAVVQFGELVPRQLAGLFWLTVVVGIAAGLALSLCGPMISHFYGNEIYASIANGIAVNIAFSCWAIVPLALLRRRKRFQTIAWIEVSSAILSGIGATWSALHGWGVSALVLKSTSNALFIFLFCCICTRPPLRSPIFSKMGYVFSYSSYQFLFNFVNYFTRNIDKLLIGKFLGSVSLGIYDMSYRLMLMPISNLTHVVTPAIQPVYAEHVNNPAIIFDSYRKLIRVLILGGGLLGAICIGCAPEIISLGYGKQWSAAVPVFSILSLSVAIQVILSSTGSVFQALGETRLLFVTGVISTATTVSAIVAGIIVGDLKTLSLLVVVSFYINSVQGFYILARFGFRRSLGELFGPSARTLIGVTIVTVISIYIRDKFITLSTFLLLCLLSKILLIGGIYFVMLIATGDIAFIRRVIAFRSRRAVA
ncbi:O-antigen/teichoic acid export membrane protein [Paraburkholderia eburnea]|uniref:O-antigen/teichoic acid export membrane protein n=1 Tax=Paraburkholderia eburnea TaxID=1189126 RepID=A0A2S4M1Q1_9BURK|nr:lipopolysaccharide biosynthesis protein [Paraburkholderia eburnea]POR48567.1 O-antigen/teichoic acid export membrane protein [Paraburkholderia eburnea]PRZ22445.1 O-antigen/teichoic acid export membrane protein [Paraburkholderia eburnea]